jgi:hypothetical protein
MSVWAGRINTLLRVVQTKLRRHWQRSHAVLPVVVLRSVFLKLLSATYTFSASARLGYFEDWFA